MRDKVLYNLTNAHETVWVFYLFEEELEACCCDDPYDTIYRYDSCPMEVWKI